MRLKAEKAHFYQEIEKLAEIKVTAV